MHPELFLVLVLGTLLPHPCIPVPHTETTNLQRLSRAHLEFALSLFRAVTKESPPSENVLLSPYSVATVLSQLWLGAEPGSPTFLELERVLRYKDGGLGGQKVHEVFHSSLDTVDDPDFQSVVKQGNALFAQEGVPIEPSYRRDLRHYYNASVEEVDFSRDGATDRVNSWVGKRTGGLIPTLVDSPLPSNTRLLLVNALALRAFWKNSFDPTRTAANGIFHQGPNSKLEIPMMAGKFKVLLGESESLRCRLLELPFRGKRLSMFILLPDEEMSSSSRAGVSTTLSYLENNLTAQNLKKLFSSLREEMVHIRMPRFSVDHSSRLTDSLMTLGLTHIFQPSQANFSRISTVEQLGVSTLAHKVTLQITEKGAHAAAATAAGIERFGEIGEFFEINRTFVFFIWDYHAGSLLFIGRIANPKPLPV